MQILPILPTTPASHTQKASNDDNDPHGLHSNLTRILAKRLYDPYTRSILSNQEIIIDTDSGLILCVKQYESKPSSTSFGDTNDEETVEWHEDLKNAKVIDLRYMQLVLPGFVDTHVHCK